MRFTALGATIGLALPLLLTAPVAALSPRLTAQTCDGLVATIVATKKANGGAIAVTGTPGDDVIVGTDANDTIDGAGGNDTICGLEGADVLIGGPGNDRLFGGLDQEYSIDDGYFGDLLLPGPGDDHVDLGFDRASRHIHPVDIPVYDQVSFRDSPGPVQVDLTAGTATGEGNDTIAPVTSGGIIGSAHDDHLVGSPGNDLIDGGAGNDTIDASRGNDHVYPDREGQDGSDHPTYGEDLPGDDVVFGGPGRDYVLSMLGQDIVDGGSGKDRLVSRTYNTGGALKGGAGKDHLEAFAGTSVLGGRGRDRIFAQVAPESPAIRVDGGKGPDAVTLRLARTFAKFVKIDVDLPRHTIRVAGRVVVDHRSAEKLLIRSIASRLTFVGTNGPDHFEASARVRVRAHGRGGNDVLLGGNGKDHLFGGKGNDLLNGFGGRDLLVGGPGRDRCLNGERVKSCESRR